MPSKVQAGDWQMKWGQVSLEVGGFLYLTPHTNDKRPLQQLQHLLIHVELLIKRRQLDKGPLRAVCHKGHMRSRAIFLIPGFTSCSVLPEE